MLLVVVALVACSGGGSHTVSTPVPTSTPTPDPDRSLSAVQILIKALAQTSPTSMHESVDSVVTAKGSTIETTQDIQQDQDVIYIESSRLGTLTRVVERVDGSCYQSGTEQTWHPVPGLKYVRAYNHGGILGQMLGSPYTGLERGEDKATDDGRPVFVVTARIEGANLNDLSDDLQSSLGSSPLAPGATVDASEVEVDVEKASLHLVAMKMTIIETLQGSHIDSTMTITYDRFDQPSNLPPDLPQSCSGSST